MNLFGLSMFIIIEYLKQRRDALQKEVGLMTEENFEGKAEEISIRVDELKLMATSMRRAFEQIPAPRKALQ